MSVSGGAFSIDLIGGVKQGDVLAPTLLVLYMAGLRCRGKNDNEKYPGLFEPCLNLFEGRRFSTTRNTHDIEYDEMVCADDVAFEIPSREIAKSETNRATRHCADWGMEDHSGTRSTKSPSKTEFSFVAAPTRMFEDVDLSEFTTGISRLFPSSSFSARFYLVIVRTLVILTPELIEAASAHCSLRNLFFQLHHPRPKRVVYGGFILAIHLHGE